jgi:hypothetical protein
MMPGGKAIRRHQRRTGFSLSFPGLSRSLLRQASGTRAPSRGTPVLWRGSDISGRIVHNARMTSSSSAAPVGSCFAGGLVVVTADRLPAWMLSSYGATWVSTPTFDALAAAGITLDRLVATALDPRRTLADLTAAGWLWAAAAAAGWPAVIVTDDPRLPERPAGVELVAVPAAPEATPSADTAGTNLARLFARAQEIVTAGRHRLVWCHAGSLGMAWDAPPSFREAYVDPDDPPPPASAHVPDLAVTADTDPDAIMGYRQAFAGQLTLFDACLGGLVAAVRALDPGWAIAVVGLRGMPLGLHGQVGCAAADDTRGRPYGEWVHLPAILVAADGRMAGQRYGDLVTPADVGATLVDLAGWRDRAASGGGDARSLIGLFTDWHHEPRDRVIVSASESMAIVTNGWHLVAECIADGERVARLFAKPDDFFELSDVADRCPAVAEELLAATAPDAPSVPLSAEALG